ncbi:MAG: CbiX/SirB N-terminal domain-containing protein [Thermonemataceae bacterium]|nr:CbiX/SirB N-terminal domain-containing protein [Thermonemataceae bacterium]
MLHKSFQLVVLKSLWIALLFLGIACSSSSHKEEKQTVQEQKIGILLVNHGSRSKTWREALLSLESKVESKIMADGRVKDVKTAFMEYNEPSIATRLKEFDREGFTDIIIVPIFLTVSPHTFEDIPTIIGQKEDPKSMEMLKIEKIERYTPKAKTHITPLLDFTNILQDNVLRRVKELSKIPEKEGLVLIGYGDEDYDKEWTDLFAKVAKSVQQETGISEYAYGWCGHIARYNPKETSKAIEKVLKKKENAVVIPVLVAHDENFQIKIIGGGIEQVNEHATKVRYKPDAILPDTNIEKWVENISKEFVEKIYQKTSNEYAYNKKN